MKVVQKRMIAAGCIGVLVIGGAVVVSKHSTYEQKENETENGTETASAIRSFLRRRQKNIMRIPVLLWM